MKRRDKWEKSGEEINEYITPYIRKIFESLSRYKNYRNNFAYSRNHTLFCRNHWEYYLSLERIRPLVYELAKELIKLNDVGKNILSELEENDRILTFFTASVSYDDETKYIRTETIEFSSRPEYLPHYLLSIELNKIGYITNKLFFAYEDVIKILMKDIE